MTAKEILIAAKARIADKNKWFGGDNPPSVPHPDNRECSLNALGAIYSEERTQAIVPEWDDARAKLSWQMGASTWASFNASGLAIIHFNDNSTHAEVMAAFDRAIEAA